MKNFLSARIISNELIAADIYSIWLHCGAIAERAKPGQFVMLYLGTGDRLLPRPLGICQVSGRDIRLIYKAVGGGTRLIGTYRAGREVTLLGPCGNTFDLAPDAPIIGSFVGGDAHIAPDAPIIGSFVGGDAHIAPDAPHARAVIIGGGLGAAPLLLLAERLPAKKTAILGFKTASEVILAADFKNAAETRITTDDGSYGTKGTPLNALSNIAKPDIIYACGPLPLLRAVAEYARINEIPAQISVEERMACGVGACCCCAVKTASGYALACTDGPIFPAGVIFHD